MFTREERWKKKKQPKSKCDSEVYMAGTENGWLFTINSTAVNKKKGESVHETSQRKIEGNEVSTKREWSEIEIQKQWKMGLCTLTAVGAINQKNTFLDCITQIHKIHIIQPRHIFNHFAFGSRRISILTLNLCDMMWKSKHKNNQSASTKKGREANKQQQQQQSTNKQSIDWITKQQISM